MTHTANNFHAALSALIEDAVAKALTAMPPASKPEQAPAITQLEILKHKECLSVKEVEALYGLKRGTLGAWRTQGRGPAYSQDGSLILYRRSDVEAYIKSNRVRTYDQPGERPARRKV